MVRLHYSFQGFISSSFRRLILYLPLDRLYLYLAMEYCPGGDMYHLLNSFERLDEPDAQLYMAEMVASVHAVFQP